MACANKRITVKLKTPNPLFEKWITEWKNNAQESGSKIQYTLAKALKSLKQYPLPLQFGKDCKILEGFGPKLCEMIDNKLIEYNENPDLGENDENSVFQLENRNASSTTKSGTKKVQQNPKRPRKSAEYVPMLRSGAHAILETLYKKSLEPDYPGFLLKIEIIKYGQHLCDKSFTRPEPGSYYTAWSSMKTLLNKNLVIKQSQPPKFSLTDQGVLLAKKLCSANVDENEYEINFNANEKRDMIYDTESVNPSSSSKASCAVSNIQIMSQNSDDLSSELDCCSASNSQKTASSLSDQEQIIFSPFNFDVFLLIDKQEISGKVATCVDDPIIDELVHYKVPFEIRHLKVGDYAWICRDKVSNKELVLPYIIERKRIDDFGKSIKDGRFHEQKFRLKQSGIQNLIYLIESHGNNQHNTGLPISTLYQAATNTLVQDGFSVKFTESWKKTAEYLSFMTSILKNMYEPKTVIGCPKNDIVKASVDDDVLFLMTFNEFNICSAKNKPLKVQDLFVRHLLQLKGVSVEKALAIVEKYPTVKLLRNEYMKDLDKGEKLLSNIQFGKLNKNIGINISKTVYELYTHEKFL